ncbi:tRNA-2-methylthio-N(6)-dimethylallyladenosine synthase [Nymphon striatum]|nr:tRNA-2-methylthio-N(6)-dimethylallyladenosine synthase [Nymphon striatum]
MVEKLEERKKVFVKTYGCQMNVYDSNRMEDALEQDGYERTNDMADADLIKEKRADTNRPMTIGVTGCVAQAEGSEIMKRAKAVDLVAGPQTYHRIADIVHRAEQGERVVETEFEIEEKFAKLPTATAKAGPGTRRCIIFNGTRRV